MQVGDMVYFDFPPSCYDWHKEYPDDTLGLIVNDSGHGCFEVMTENRGVEEIHGHYLVAAV